MVAENKIPQKNRFAKCGKNFVSFHKIVKRIDVPRMPTN
jgi:hypothetical protein